jgi:hypothetical protein
VASWRRVALCVALFGLGAAYADEAAHDYLLYCSGCHRDDGSGSAANQVPPLPGSVGNFVHTAAGRAFLIQIAGVAQTPLDDAALARLMNWLLARFGTAELPTNFQPYTGTEVAHYRATRPADLSARRASIVAELAERGMSVANY